MKREERREMREERGWEERRREDARRLKKRRERMFAEALPQLEAWSRLGQFRWCFWFLFESDRAAIFLSTVPMIWGCLH